MLNNVGELITEFLVRNSINTTDGYVTDAMLREWVSDAHTIASSFYKWPFTEGKASTTFSTAIQDEVGNTIVPYPEGWKADSVRIMTIGGKRMQKMNFESFLRTLENNTNLTTSRMTRRIYTDYARQLYVNTNADVSGTMTVYGQYFPILDVTDYTAVTVFSGYDQEGNEAILELMTSFYKTRANDLAAAKIAKDKAVEMLGQIYKRVGDEQYAYQAGDMSMFDYVNVLRGRGGSYNNNQSREDRWE